VGGLPYSATEDELRTAFEQAGSVTSASIITDRYSGQSRGFGFVEMATNEEAQAAIRMLNGSTLGGRTLTVNEARERDEGGPRRSGPGGRSGGGRW
jgi:RNA recognition motif-containing protein